MLISFFLYYSVIAPSKYIQKLQEHPQVQLTDQEMDQILLSHCIPFKHLRQDDFEAFYEERKGRLLSLIESAIGKQILYEIPESELNMNFRKTEVPLALLPK